MLKLLVHLPEPNPMLILEAGADMPDASVDVIIRLCRLEWCRLPFIPAKPEHDFCCRSHRITYHNKLR